MKVRRLREDELCHYGVKGMKWRNRKAHSEDGKSDSPIAKVKAVGNVAAKMAYNLFIKKPARVITGKHKKVSLKQIGMDSATYKGVQKLKDLTNKFYKEKLTKVASKSSS